MTDCKLKTNTPMFFDLIEKIMRALPNGVGFPYATIHTQVSVGTTAAYRRETTHDHEYIVKQAIYFLSDLGICVSYPELTDESYVGVIELEYLSEMQLLDGRVKRWLDANPGGRYNTAVYFNESETLNLLRRLNKGRDRSVTSLNDRIAAYGHRHVIDQSLARIDFEASRPNSTVVRPNVEGSDELSIPALLKSIALLKIEKQKNAAHENFHPVWDRLIDFMKADGLALKIRYPIVSSELDLVLTGFNLPVSRDIAALAMSSFPEE